MALTAKSKARLVSGLTRKGLANEFEAAMTTPAPLSAPLKAAIISMMANKAAALELIAALESVGAEKLSGPAKPNAKKRLENAVTSKKASAEIQAALDVDHTPEEPEEP